MFRKSLLLLTFVGLTAAGCSTVPLLDQFESSKSRQKKDARKLAAIASKPVVPPRRLLNTGIEKINKGNRKAAQAAFATIDKEHPFSSEAQRSLVLSAYSHFKDEEYGDAVQKARRFLQLYPGAKDAAYMQYLIGESHLQQVNVVILDQQDTQKGVRAFRNLIRLYPDSKYAADAKTKLIFLNDQLAGKEMQIGRYYQERRQHLAAVNRFKTVAGEYQRTRHVEEALFRLTESYLALGLVNDARSSAALLGHNYPESDWYGNAYKLVTDRKVQVAQSSSKKKEGRLARLVPFVGGDDENANASVGNVAESANTPELAVPTVTTAAADASDVQAPTAQTLPDGVESEAAVIERPALPPSRTILAERNRLLRDEDAAKKAENLAAKRRNELAIAEARRVQAEQQKRFAALQAEIDGKAAPKAETEEERGRLQRLLGLGKKKEDEASSVTSAPSVNAPDVEAQVPSDQRPDRASTVVLPSENADQVFEDAGVPNSVNSPTQADEETSGLRPSLRGSSEAAEEAATAAPAAASTGTAPNDVRQQDAAVLAEQAITARQQATEKEKSKKSITSRVQSLFGG